MKCEIATLQMSKKVKNKLDQYVRARGMKLKFCADEAITEYLEKHEDLKNKDDLNTSDMQ